MALKSKENFYQNWQHTIESFWGLYDTGIHFKPHPTTNEAVVSVVLDSDWKNFALKLFSMDFNNSSPNLPEDAKKLLLSLLPGADPETKLAQHKYRFFSEIQKDISDTYSVYSTDGLLKKIDKLRKKWHLESPDTSALLDFTAAKMLLDANTPTQNPARNALVALELLKRIPRNSPNFAEAQNLLAIHHFATIEPDKRKKGIITTLHFLCNAGSKADPVLSQQTIASIFKGYPPSGTMVSDPLLNRVMGPNLVETLINACEYLPQLSREVKNLKEAKPVQHLVSRELETVTDHDEKNGNGNIPPSGTATAETPSSSTDSGSYSGSAQ